MTAAVPANGDGIRVCRIYNRRQSFISAGERNLLRQQELCVFGSSLGVAPRQPGTFVFRSRALMFFLTFSNNARGLAGRTDIAAQACIRRTDVVRHDGLPQRSITVVISPTRSGKSIFLRRRPRAPAGWRQRSPPARAHGRCAAPRRARRCAGNGRAKVVAFASLCSKLQRLPNKQARQLRLPPARRRPPGKTPRPSKPADWHVHC